MATVTRRYHLAGPTDEELQAEVHPSAVNAGKVSVSVDISVDDSINGVLDALDEVMGRHGFIFEMSAPPASTDVEISSPNGTVWRVGVSNLGLLTIVAV